MSFNGTIIKSKAKEAGYTLLRLAQELGVSRQTINAWSTGVVPRGSHLVKLCSILNMKPGDFFAQPTESLLSVPLHRTIRNVPVSASMRESSQQLAQQYLNLFRQAPIVEMLPVLRVKQKKTENAEIIANKLREFSGIGDDKPMDYKSAFRLLSRLGIYTVFREFPVGLRKKSYAFYSRISGHRVVFVNIDISPLDLIFQLLHETVHAIRDEEPGAIDVVEEEKLCDNVAELTQFPDFYANTVGRYITESDDQGIIINRMKEVSRKNQHSLFGIYYRLKHKGMMPDGVKVGGAATNLKTGVPVLRKILFSHENPRHYVDMLYELSPNFMKLIQAQVPQCSIRKLGEWLGLDTSMDAQEVMNEISYRNEQPKG
ncbi:XRE family transcriptional regulator [Chitinispirillales bacterium ANBcel5]|uniref:helix-turn-helix domain-containing protein n=1 Tax=Cellulosispirillum alkaliphilum TaxID=3039283 RepID=UPI002A500BED|nr:XRE family transcriptional regulator [Chitinispirillales bacterium ANBcel5]